MSSSATSDGWRPTLRFFLGYGASTLSFMIIALALSYSVNTCLIQPLEAYLRDQTFSQLVPPKFAAWTIALLYLLSPVITVLAAYGNEVKHAYDNLLESHDTYLDEANTPLWYWVVADFRTVYLFAFVPGTLIHIILWTTFPIWAHIHQLILPFTTENIATILTIWIGVLMLASAFALVRYLPVELQLAREKEADLDLLEHPKFRLMFWIRRCLRLCLLWISTWTILYVSIRMDMRVAHSLRQQIEPSLTLMMLVCLAYLTIFNIPKQDLRNTLFNARCLMFKTYALLIVTLVFYEVHFTRLYKASLDYYLSVTVSSAILRQLISLVSFMLLGGLCICSILAAAFFLLHTALSESSLRRYPTKLQIQALTSMLMACLTFPLAVIGSIIESRILCGTMTVLQSFFGQSFAIAGTMMLFMVVPPTMMLVWFTIAEKLHSRPTIIKNPNSDANRVDDRTTVSRASYVRAVQNSKRWHATADKDAIIGQYLPELDGWFDSKGRFYAGEDSHSAEGAQRSTERWCASTRVFEREKERRSLYTGEDDPATVRIRLVAKWTWERNIFFVFFFGAIGTLMGGLMANILVCPVMQEQK